MPNNVTLLDVTGTTRVMKTTETAGVNVSHINVDSALPAGANVIGKVSLQAGGLDVSGANRLPVVSAPLEAAAGAPADSAYAGTGSASQISALKGIYAKLGAITLGAGSSVIGKVSLQIGGTDIGSTNPLFVSDPSAEAGIGSPADAIYAGTGSTSVVSALKGVYAKLGSGIVLGGGSSAIGKVSLLVSGSDVTGFTPLPVSVSSALPAGENRIGSVGGTSVTVTGRVTRPSNTTAYVAGSVIAGTAGTPITFSNALRVNAGSAYLVGCTLVVASNQATAPQVELWLFKVAPTTSTANGATWAPTIAELRNCMGVIPFPNKFVANPATGALGSLVYQVDSINKVIVADTGSRAVYGVLVVRNAYSPVSGETFDVILTVSQD